MTARSCGVRQRPLSSPLDLTATIAAQCVLQPRCSLEMSAAHRRVQRARQTSLVPHLSCCSRSLMEDEVTAPGFQSSARAGTSTAQRCDEGRSTRESRHTLDVGEPRHLHPGYSRLVRVGGSHQPIRCFIWFMVPRRPAHEGVVESTPLRRSGPQERRYKPCF